MTRTTVRTSLNGKSRVSHAKPPAQDPIEDDDDDHPQTTVADDVPAGPSPVDSLTEMMNGLQGATSARITVYRVIKNQKPAYVFECDPSTFSLDDLRDKYNGGEFRLYIVKDGRLWRNMSVVVEPKQMSVHDPLPPAAQVSDVVSLMRESLTQQTTMIRDMLASRPAPSSFNMADLPAIITAAAAAITALRPPVAPVAPPAPDTSSKAIDMFMQGLQMARELRDDAGPQDNSLGGMLREALRSPIVSAAVQSAMQPGQTPAQPQQQQQPRLPNPNPPAQVSHAKPAEPAAGPQPKPEEAMLAYYLGFLVSKAQSGAEPSLYAELVLDNVPDAQLMPMLNRGDQLVDDFIAIYPPVAQHREWFVKLIHEVNDLLEPEPEGAEVIQPGDAHAADAATTVVPGQPSA